VESCLYLTSRADSFGHSLAQRMMIDENTTPTGVRPLPAIPETTIGSTSTPWEGVVVGNFS
jgi:hypothetical protein